MGQSDDGEDRERSHTLSYSIDGTADSSDHVVVLNILILRRISAIQHAHPQSRLT